VRVSANGQAERLFARAGTKGNKAANFIIPGRSYDFRLYDHNAPANDPLAEVVVGHRSAPVSKAPQSISPTSTSGTGSQSPSSSPGTGSHNGILAIAGVGLLVLIIVFFWWRRLASRRLVRASPEVTATVEDEHKDRPPWSHG
jgi:LPXTG-motif cell wall-anchored protein